MSKAKFTKGPWQTSYRKNKKGMYSQDVYCEKGETICTCDWYPVDEGSGITSTNREGNAHLIAAAPEMYAALNSLVESGIGNMAMHNTVVDLLAKARGEHE